MNTVDDPIEPMRVPTFYRVAACAAFGGIILKPNPILQNCAQIELESLLSEVSARLGTAAEKPDDLDHARSIAHQLNNILTAIRLLAEQ